MKKFPKLLYVIQDEDGGETFEIAYRDLSKIETNATVAVYKLEAAGQLVVERKFKSKTI